LKLCTCIVVAVDGDRMVNNDIKYSLLNENDLFGIDSQSGIIYTKATLDRDRVLGGSYILQVVVKLSYLITLTSCNFSQDTPRTLKLNISIFC
jgi:hypothetical protein